MDFPKTIYATRKNKEVIIQVVYDRHAHTEDESDATAIYTLKEVKKKVTEVKLEDI